MEEKLGDVRVRTQKSPTLRLIIANQVRLWVLALGQAKSQFKQKGKGCEIIMGGERKAGSQDNIVFIKYIVYFLLPF